jgi:tetratricopeptide (TPR) repeat protein
LTRGERIGLVAVLALALAFRLAAHGGMADHPRTFAPLVDSEAYLLQSLRVAAGEPLVEGITFQAPLYPWLLGWTLAAAGSPGAAGVDRLTEVPREVVDEALAVGRALNLAFGLALVVLLWLVGRALFSPAAGLWAAGLAAVSSPLVTYEGHLLKVSLSVLVLPLAVLAAARALRTGRARSWLLVGVVLGCGGLVRGNMYLLAWGAALLLLLAGLRARTPRAGLARAACVLLGVGLAMAPVVLRNSLVAGRPVLATAAGGTAFFLCNHAGNDTGLVEFTSLNRQVPRHEEGDWHEAAERAQGRELTAAEVSNHWMDQALTDIREDPARWLRLEARKVGLLFSRYEAPDNTLVALGEADVPLLARTPSRWEVVVPLAFGGLLLAWWSRRRGPSEGGGGAEGAGGLADSGDAAGAADAHGIEGAGDAGGAAGVGGRTALVLAAAGYAASLLLFNMTSRFRMPVEPLGMLWAGYALASLPGLLATGTWPRRLAVAAAVLAGLAAGRASEGPLGPLDDKELAGHLATRYLNRALLAREQGDLAAATADLDRAATVSLEVGVASPSILVEQATIDRARALAAAEAGEKGNDGLRNWMRASERLREALRLSPDHGPAHRLTGLMSYDAGKFEEALPSFEAALDAVPRDRESRQYLSLALLALSRATEAELHAQVLADDHPDEDVGFGLLALARLARADEIGARAALESYDRLASMREASGRSRLLPDQPAFSELRQDP